jgi:hypothetical protein
LKMRIALLFLLTLCLTLAALPAMASTSYDNGPVNGQTDGWAFSGGFQNTETFQFDVPGHVNSFSAWIWLVPGESLTNVQLGMGTSAFDTSLFNGFLGAPTSTDGCFGPNGFGYNVCDEHWTNISGTPLLGTTQYWLTLQNGATLNGTQPFWDENSGIGCTGGGCPSLAYLNNGVGSIPSEAFTITNNGSGGTTPEPSSILLFGSGILGLAGVLRRKLTR